MASNQANDKSIFGQSRDFFFGVLAISVIVVGLAYLGALTTGEWESAPSVRSFLIGFGIICLCAVCLILLHIASLMLSAFAIAVTEIGSEIRDYAHRVSGKNNPAPKEDTIPGGELK